jgi:formylglycine-generating enzyme
MNYKKICKALGPGIGICGYLLSLCLTPLITGSVIDPMYDPLVVLMKLIDPGAFQMGSPETEGMRYEDETLHGAKITKPFYMQLTEVTQMHWQSVMGYNPSQFKGDLMPVNNISWFEIIEYCNKRSTLEKLRPCYTRNDNQVIWDKSANGFRLPTEAEWEYACRAGSRTPFNTGENITTDQASYDGQQPYLSFPKGILRDKPLNVKSFPANAWGLYEMHGNVAEWVWDWYDSYSSAAVVDPSGPPAGTRKVIRGGGWFFNAADCRSADRYENFPTYKNGVVGFRLARNAPEKEAKSK